jgi:hypothetical protein
LSALTLLVGGLAASTAWSIGQARIAAQARVQAEHERDRAGRALEESDRQRSIADRNAVEAAKQRGVAQDRFHRARKLTHRFLFDVEDALRDAVGATKARQLLVSTALEHFEQMGREAADDPQLIRDLARAYDRIGDLQGYPAAANLGDTVGAVKSYRQSLDWHRKIWSEPSTRLLAGYTATKLAKTLRWNAQVPEAEKAFEQAAASFANLETALSPDLRLELIRYRSNLNRAWGEHWQSRDQHERAVGLVSASTKDLRRAIAAQPDDISFQRLLSSDNLTLSRSWVALEDWREALHTAEAGVSVMRAAIGPKPIIRDQGRLIPPGIQLVDVLEMAPEPIRNIERALAIDAELIGIGEKLVALDAPNARNQAMLANILSRHAGHLRNSWRWAEALAAYQRSQAITEGLAKATPSNGFYGDLLGTNAVFMGRLLNDMNDDAAAAKALRLGIVLLEKGVAAGRLNNQPNLSLARECLAQIEP